MNSELHRTDLEDLGVLRIAGPDAVRFLQGQLSSDVTRVAAGQAPLAGYHNPQGRTIALLRLVALAEGELLALLPRELAASVAQRLAKYVLRAKVAIAEVSHEWRVSALAPSAELTLGEPAGLGPAPHAGAPRGAGEPIRLALGEHSAGWLELAPRSAASRLDPAAREQWRLLEIRAGIPQVYAATSERFVAQMLNLDALGAIAFEKGCYSGQEVIARAHYRGRVKRRAQRFRSRAPLTLAPGETGVLADGRTFEVVHGASLPDGRCEFLAVAPLEPPESASPGEALAVDAEPLELPYALAP
jgi:folate-binding protein YgfZ